MTHPHPNFDLISRPYRWLEYLILGRSLERTRLHFLRLVSDRTHALVLGDGDGRFLAHLLQQSPALHEDVVDISATMLHLLRKRCLQVSPTAALRLKTHHADALTYLQGSIYRPYDLIVTHFFLDCLTQAEVHQLVNSIALHILPGSIWLVSEFNVPSGLMRWPARLLIKALYLGFRLLTGLRVSHLPDHAAALSAAGFELSARHTFLYGILVSELWQFPC